MHAALRIAKPAATRQEIDEVVDLGLRLGRAMNQEYELQSQSATARRAKEHSAGTRLDRASEHSSDEVSSLRDMITSMRAKSLSGAAIQLAEALNRVDAVWDQFPQESETYYIQRDVRAINRLLYSVLEVVDGLAKQKLADVVTPEFGSPYLNPWLSEVQMGQELGAVLEVRDQPIP